MGMEKKPPYPLPDSPPFVVFDSSKVWGTAGTFKYTGPEAAAFRTRRRIAKWVVTIGVFLVAAFIIIWSSEMLEGSLEKISSRLGSWISSSEGSCVPDSLSSPDGCNTCRCGEDGETLLCTKILCTHLQFQDEVLQ